MQEGDRDDLLFRPLAEVPLAFVDVETTGLRPDQGDRVCEIAIVVFQGERELGRFHSLINPHRPISPEAAAVNGLSDEMVRHAPGFADVAEQVARTLSLGTPAAHNAPFDLAFLRRELPDWVPILGAHRVVDTLALARRLLPHYRHGLQALAARLGLPKEEQAHRALADVMTTRALFSHLVALPAASLCQTLDGLFALQREGWYRRPYYGSSYRAIPTHPPAAGAPRGGEKMIGE